MQAIATATSLCEWLDILAHARGMSLMALAHELGTPQQLAEEIGRYIAHGGMDDGIAAWHRKEQPDAPTPQTSLRARVAYHTYMRLKLDDLAKADAEADAALETMMQR